MYNFEFSGEAVHDAEKAAVRSAMSSADPLDAAHAVVTALEPHVENHTQFVRRATLTGMGQQDDAEALRERITEALDLAEAGSFDGAHHKMWVIDQMVRALTGEGYDKWVEDFCAGEDGPDTYEWDTGIAP